MKICVAFLPCVYLNHYLSQRGEWAFIRGFYLSQRGEWAFIRGLSAHKLHLNNQNILFVSNDCHLYLSDKVHHVYHVFYDFRTMPSYCEGTFVPDGRL